MDNTIAEIKVALAKLTAEVSSIKLDAADTRIHLKATMGDLNRIAGQVNTLDQQIEANHQKAEAQAKEQKTTTEAKEMTMTEICKLYKADPTAGRKALEAQGMQLETGNNPWQYTDKLAQSRIEESDPELAAKLKAEAQAAYSASLR